MEIAVLQVRDHHATEGSFDDLTHLDKLLEDFLLDVCGFVVAEDDMWLVLAMVQADERRTQNTWHVIKSAIVTERRYKVETANDLERRRGA
jgi:hypothetical protein